MFQYEIVSEPTRFRSLSQQWNDLHRRAGGSVFSTHGYLCAKIETSEERSRALHAIVVWEGDRLVAGACLARRKAKVARKIPFKATKLTFVDEFDTGWNDILIDPNVTDAPKAMVNALKKKGRARVADLFPLSTVGGGALFLAAARDAGREIDDQVELKTAVCDTTGGQAEYLSRRTRSTRSKITRMVGLQDKDNLEFVFACDDDPAAHDLLDECFEMSFHSWKAEQGTNIGNRPEECAFLHRLVDEPPEGTRFCVEALRLDGVVVAYSFSLRRDDTTFALITDYDQRYKKQGFGRSVCVRSVLEAAEAGFTKFDTLRMTGLSEPLYDWSNDLHRTHLKLGFGLAPLVVSLERLLRTFRDRSGLKSERTHGRRKFKSQS